MLFKKINKNKIKNSGKLVYLSRTTVVIISLLSFEKFLCWKRLLFPFLFPLLCVKSFFSLNVLFSSLGTFTVQGEFAKRDQRSRADNQDGTVNQGLFLTFTWCIFFFCQKNILQTLKNAPKWVSQLLKSSKLDLTTMSETSVKAIIKWKPVPHSHSSCNPVAVIPL